MDLRKILTIFSKTATTISRASSRKEGAWLFWE